MFQLPVKPTYVLFTCQTYVCMLNLSNLPTFPPPVKPIFSHLSNLPMFPVPVKHTYSLPHAPINRTYITSACQTYLCSIGLSTLPTYTCKISPLLFEPARAPLQQINPSSLHVLNIPLYDNRHSRQGPYALVAASTSTNHTPRNLKTLYSYIDVSMISTFLHFLHNIYILLQNYVIIYVIFT